MAEIKIRAERRAGEMLGDMERVQPSDVLLRGNTTQPRERPTLSDLGISKIQSHRWQQEASVTGVTLQKRSRQAIHDRTQGYDTRQNPLYAQNHGDNTSGSNPNMLDAGNRARPIVSPH